MVLLDNKNVKEKATKRMELHYLPDKRTLGIGDKETILEAALKNGIPTPMPAGESALLYMPGYCPGGVTPLQPTHA